MSESKMICVFCNAEFTPDMVLSEYYASEGGDTCGYGSTVTYTVEIHCESCGKLVYKKEGTQS